MVGLQLDRALVRKVFTAILQDKLWSLLFIQAMYKLEVSKYMKHPAAKETHPVELK